MQQKEENLDRKLETIEKKEESLAQKHAAMEKEQEEIRTIKQSQTAMLEKISGFTADEAKGIPHSAGGERSDPRDCPQDQRGGVPDEERSARPAPAKWWLRPSSAARRTPWPS